MSESLSWTVDEREACTVLTVSGSFDLGDIWRLRQAAMKCLAEQPRALLIDLSAMRFEDETVLALFTAVTRQAAQWPGSAVLLCGPTPEAAVLFARGRYGALTVHPSVAVALDAVEVGEAVAPVLTDHLQPVPSAPSRGRGLVTEACTAWGLPDVTGPATLVMSELVSNAVEHAGTALIVQITRRPRLVHIAVRDGSPDAPVPGPADPPLAQRGRGLRLVEAESAHWGWLPTHDGKVVWAALAADPT